MPLTSTGTDVTLTYDASSGKYDITYDTSGTNVGNLAFDTTESHAVLSLILERKGEWFADTSGRRGSLVHTVTVDVRIAASKLQAYIEDALQPLVEARRIKAVAVTATRTTPGRYDVRVKYQTPDGAQQTVRTPLTY